MSFVTLINHDGHGEHKIAVDDILKYEESFATGNTFLRIHLKSGETVTTYYNQPGSALTAHVNMRRLKAALKRKDKK